MVAVATLLPYSHRYSFSFFFSPSGCSLFMLLLTPTRQSGSPLGCLSLQKRSRILLRGLFSRVVSLLTVGGKIEEKFVEDRRVFAMEEKQIAVIGSFCWNETCAD